jgi:hypothetical protein
MIVLIDEFKNGCTSTVNLQNFFHDSMSSFPKIIPKEMAVH